MSKTRTRFAPSPTGYMHVGNLRTALYAYLLAKKDDGTFILRIEDTDRERYVEGAVDIIYNSLRSAGLHWDEGPDCPGAHGPYVQSERMEIYMDYARELIERGGAYYCFCKKERLEEVRAIQQASGAPPKYDGHCRSLSADEISSRLSAGEEFVIRQRMPENGTTSFADCVFGEISVENSTLDDQVLIKADGMPTYNFANVVDDHLMNITHVIRGSEYLSSTPKYNLLYDSFGWEKPQYVHCPPVMKNATEKLSKRNGDASFEDLIEKGFLPAAVINYIALLGWSPGGENEIFSLEELKEVFSVSGISKSPAIFDPLKLRAINAEHIRRLSPDEWQTLAEPYINSAVKRKDIDFPLLCRVLQPRAECLCDIPPQLDFIDATGEYATELFVHKKMKTNRENSLSALKEILPVLQALDVFNMETVHNALFLLIEKMGAKNGTVLWPLRTALSGRQFTPGGGVELAAVLGREETLLRIKAGIALLESEK